MTSTDRLIIILGAIFFTLLSVVVNVWADTPRYVRNQEDNAISFGVSIKEVNPNEKNAERF